MSISRCSGPFAPRCGIFTASVFWRRLRVLKSGTVQFRPIRSGKPRQNQSPAASTLSLGPMAQQCQPCRTAPSWSDRSGSMHRCRFAVAHACHSVRHPRSCQGRTSLTAIARQSPTGQRIVSEPRRLSAFAIGLKPMAHQWLTIRGPVQGLTGRRVRFAHPPKLSRWIRQMNPLRPFVQQSPRRTCS